MYLEHLHIQNFKLITDMKLSFLNEEDFTDEHGVQHKKGEPRMWTVLIGRNARGKTSILQAIALAISSETTANLLIDGRATAFKHLGKSSEAQIQLAYSYGSKLKATTSSKIQNSIKKQKNTFLSEATDFLEDSHRDFIKFQRQFNEFLTQNSQIKSQNELNELKELNDKFEQIKKARERIYKQELQLNIRQFSIAYGPFRTLPLPTIMHTEDPPRHRLQSLFSSSHQINGTNFIEHLRAIDRMPDKEMSNGYLQILEDLLSNDLKILPEVKAFRARGKGEIPEQDFLALEHRVVTNIGGREIEVPTTWLSQGYQAMFSWIADMIGWACLEQKRAVPPAEIEGIALIDEIDLFLHPTWQVNLIPTLRKIFPKVQFVVTTHSPLVLSSLRPEEIVVLELDETGEVVASNGPGQVPDPRLRTMGELASEFFEIHRMYPQSLAAKHDEYVTIAVNSARSAEQSARALALQAEFDRMNIKYIPMVPAEEVPSLDDWFKEDEQGG